MKLGDLFESDVTRDIPPVVYFHEQSPDKLADEVDEYIITGGWPEEHPNRRRVPSGIHEQYVQLLDGIAGELEKQGGAELPAAWISGFYGSGKSSFAKLLGLALDGAVLPDGRPLAEAWLARDTSPRAGELRRAWARLREQVKPIAVVFDVGAAARDNEQIHACVVRQVQRRLGYCTADPSVADFELRLERDGEWERFERAAARVLGRPWAAVKDRALAEEDFSAVMSALDPGRYPDPMAWYASRAGSRGGAGAGSPEDAALAIRDMLKRAPDATLFVVIDEVSQYVRGSRDRVDRLRAFATALGAALRGKAWLVALGQQKLDDEEGAEGSSLHWIRDRFPPRLRVHLHPTNIRDVVHRRLLAKRPAGEAVLREAFDRARTDLKLFAYGGGGLTPEDFVEVYPLLPGQIDLLLQITSALRARSSRAQGGDDQGIRGLLQLLGELFRGQRLADAEVGTLIGLDRIYDVLHGALDPDAQASMARILDRCAGETTGEAAGELARAAKAVALLELIQEAAPTDGTRVAQVLYDRLDRGSNVRQVGDALEELRRRNLLGYSEKHGYKLQSSAGEEWEGERRDLGVSREAVGEIVQEALRGLLGEAEPPRIGSRAFAWEGVYGGGAGDGGAVLVEARDDATVRVDLRLVAAEERAERAWIRRSAERELDGVLVWIAGDPGDLEARARELVRSRAMVKRYRPRRESMTAARRALLQQEEGRAWELERGVREAAGAAWLGGTLYFRGEPLAPRAFGDRFEAALHGVATRKLPDLYHRFVATAIAPSELMQLLEPELSGPSPKYLGAELGLLELDGGRHVATCTGVVPRRVLEQITDLGGVGGAALLARFGGPPYGYPANVVKACVAGLLRAGQLRISPEVGDDLAAVRDAGVKELFEKDRAFRRATIYPAGDDGVGYQARARICKLFEDELGHRMERDDHHIADAVQAYFPGLASRARAALGRIARLPGGPRPPEALVALEAALEACLRRVRQTQPTVQQVKGHLAALRDGVRLLSRLDAELTEDVVERMRAAAAVRDREAAQLAELGAVEQPIADAAAGLGARCSSWQAVAEAEALAAAVRAAYVAERTRLLRRQEDLAGQARSRIKTRDGFSALSGEQAGHVLRPIAEAQTDTTAEDTAPPLSQLRDAFDGRLQRAEALALERLIERLDEVRAGQGGARVVEVDLGLRHRELSGEAEVEALIAELRERLRERLDAAAAGEGARIRIV